MTQSFDVNILPFDDSVLEGSISDRFEAVAARFADRTAIRSHSRSMTYDELNRAANRVAWALLDHEPGDEAPVAIFLGKALDTLIAMLGVLKAGHFYTVLDAQSPPERLAAILDDAQPDLILTDDERRGLIESPERATLLWQDIGEDRLDANPTRAIDPQRPMGLYYSSGSTGEPKGVIWTHYLLLGNLQYYAEHYLRPSLEDRFSHILSTAFGASTSMIFGALLTGACLSVFDVKAHDLEELAVWLREERITLFHPPVALFRHFLQSLEPGARFPDVRVITLGGDALYSDDVRQARPHFSDDCVLINRLASQETNLTACHVIARDTPLETEMAPVGSVVEIKQARIVDDEGREVPVGETGELIIKSRFISPGYWRKPALNARFFTADSGDPAIRIFRTGDMARIRPDGILEFAGRKDLVVKIRGYRVVIDEVEMALMRHPALEDAAVWTRIDFLGEKRLIGYYTVAEGESVSAADLRDWLGEIVAEYMIPSFFIELDELPMTATGKIDRQSLPAPDMGRPELSTPFEGPRDGIEQELKVIWEAVLAITPVGIHDDFFDLGGHSLLALQLVTRIKQDLDLDLPIDSLLQASAIADMAALIREKGERKPRILLPLKEGKDRPALFVVHPRGGHLMAYHALIKNLSPDQPVYGLQAQGLHGEAPPLTRVPDMAALYIREMMAVQPQGPYFLLGYSMGGLVAFEVALQLERAGAKVGRLIMIDTAFQESGSEETDEYRQWKERRKKIRTEPEHRSLPDRIRSAFQEDIEALRAANAAGKLAYLGSRLKHFWDWYAVRMAYRIAGREAAFHEARWSPTRRLKNANIAAARAYTPESQLKAPVTLLRGHTGLRKRAAENWDAWTVDPLEVIDFDSRHRGFLEDPLVSEVAALVMARLEAQ